MLISQLSGAVIFYLLFNWLDKPVIGAISWSLSVLMIFFTILGFGLDQLAVKQVATGVGARSIFSSYLCHVLITGLTTLFMVLLLRFTLFRVNNTFPLFLWLAVSQCLLYFSSPFKQLANGKERFVALMFMSTTANMVRVIGLILLITIHALSINLVLFLYAFSSLLELLVCLFYYVRHAGDGFRVSCSMKRYRRMIKKAMPQMGIVVCNVLLSRMDWVLLGLISSATVVAEYGFAYKFFELSTLPLLIAGPLLLPWIAKMFRAGTPVNTNAQNNSLLISIIRMELSVAVFITLMVNIGWEPVIGWITAGKYGNSNATITFILSLAAPLLYANNILWSVSFSQGRLRSIFSIFLITCLANLVADLVLIPFYQGTGAAIGFLLATTIQFSLYLHRSSLQQTTKIISHLLLLLLAAYITWFVAIHAFQNAWMQLITACFGYIVLLASTRQLKLTDTIPVRKIIGT